MEANKIIDEYNDSKDIFKSYSDVLQSLLSGLLRNKGFEVHSITPRVKTLDSLVKKIRNKPESYEKLSDLTDICGIRIITYFSDDVDKISELIETEFNVDLKNSIDKRAVLNPDRFGYLSQHYVVTINDERSKLTEYSIFKNNKAEIQIRSILQHAWAEIEHDIGYKSTIEVPRHIRRKFSRLAGLLELADDEFVAIRKSLTQYEGEVKLNINTNPQSVTLDLISLEDYMNNNSKIKELDTNVAEIKNFNLTQADNEDVSSTLEYLEYFGIQNIAQLNETLNHFYDAIIKRANFTKDHIHEGEKPIVSNGISLFYLAQVLSASNGDKTKAKEFFDEFNIGLDPERENFLDYLIEINKA